MTVCGKAVAAENAVVAENVVAEGRICLDYIAVRPRAPCVD